MLSLALQLAPPPMRAFPIGIEGLELMTTERLQRRDASKLDRPAVFGRVCQHFSRGQDRRHVVIGFRDSPAEMRDGFP